MSKRLVFGVFALAGLAQSAGAELRRCPSADKGRAVLALHNLVPLAKAMRGIKADHAGDVIRFRLRQQGRRLVYVLTVLPRSGKVTHAWIDTATGAIVGRS